MIQNEMFSKGCSVCGRVYSGRQADFILKAHELACKACENMVVSVCNRMAANANDAENVASFEEYRQIRPKGAH